MPSDRAEFSVGQRVCEVSSSPSSGAHSSSRATVRFVGAVGDTAGTWVGVEWDDPERGRHDGSHGGVRYFHTRSGDGDGGRSASFVRPKKLDGGVSLGRAVRERYGEVAGETAGVDEEVLSGLRKEINAPFLEVVGFDRVNRQQSDFTRLRVVSLRASRVCGLRGFRAEEGKAEEEQDARLSEWMPKASDPPTPNFCFILHRGFQIKPSRFCRCGS